MYRRLVLFGLTVVAVAVTALVIPLGLAARDIVRAERVSEIAEHGRQVAIAWQRSFERSGSDDGRPTGPLPAGPGEVTLLLPDGQVVGPAPPPAAQTLVDSARAGAAGTRDTGNAAFATTPVLLDEEGGVVLVTLDAAGLREGLMPRLAAIAAVCIALLAAAAGSAWLLARQTVRPIRRLAATADAIADGDLTARVGPSSIVEVQDVGTALNRMSGRVQELLADERASAAELAHQLRTPLTALTIDIDAVTDEEVRARLQEDALALQRTTDEIIGNARRATREGLRASCDAVRVVADRARFWQVLADDQHRATTLALPTQPVLVRLTADDLATLVDILLQNVFLHTPEGMSYDIVLAAVERGAARFTVADRGPGFPAMPDAGAGARQRPGSSGLGLSIAGRLAQASGGRLDVANSPGGGAVVTVILGPAAA